MIILHKAQTHTQLLTLYFDSTSFSCNSTYFLAHPLSLRAILLVHTALAPVPMPRVAIRNYGVPRLENRHLVRQEITNVSLLSVTSLHFTFFCFHTSDFKRPLHITPRSRHVAFHSFLDRAFDAITNFGSQLAAPTSRPARPAQSPSRRPSPRCRLPNTATSRPLSRPYCRDHPPQNTDRLRLLPYSSRQHVGPSRRHRTSTRRTCWVSLAFYTRPHNFHVTHNSLKHPFDSLTSRKSTSPMAVSLPNRDHFGPSPLCAAQQHYLVLPFSDQRPVSLVVDNKLYYPDVHTTALSTTLSSL